MTFELPTLPYSDDALEPFYSAKTISFHHKKHHNAYVNNLNNLIKGTEFENMSLIEIIKASSNKNAGIFNNSAQVWNHSFFWNSMSPNGGGVPKGAIFDKINSDFGSFEKFIEEFKTAATTQFGSGWAWLVLSNNGKLQITQTPNAETPITNVEKPLICIDVWEHSYYLDYQNLRPKYIETFLEKLVNWDFANQNLDGELFAGI